MELLPFFNMWSSTVTYAFSPFSFLFVIVSGQYTLVVKCKHELMKVSNFTFLELFPYTQNLMLRYLHFEIFAKLGKRYLALPQEQGFLDMPYKLFDDHNILPKWKNEKFPQTARSFSTSSELICAKEKTIFDSNPICTIPISILQRTFLSVHYQTMSRLVKAEGIEFRGSR